MQAEVNSQLVLILALILAKTCRLAAADSGLVAAGAYHNFFSPSQLRDPVLDILTTISMSRLQP